MMLGVFIANSCSKPDTLPETDTTGMNKFVQVQDACDCGSKPSCPADRIACIENLLGTGNTTRNFILHWQSCASPYSSGIVSETSNVTVCYSPASPTVCSSITFKITNPPSYLPCVPDPFCMPLTLTCEGNSWTFSSIAIDPFGASVSVTITNDPVVTITCSSGDGNFYNCVGEIQL
jgi:hypothetical protein